MMIVRNVRPDWRFRARRTGFASVRDDDVIERAREASVE
jgi:hypothetical protein